MREMVREEVAGLYFSEERADQILKRVHQQIMEEDRMTGAPMKESGQRTGVLSIRERRMRMRYNKKRTGVLIAAALVVMGAVTAVAAGKVAYTSTGHSVDDQVDSVAAFLPQAKGALGQVAKIPETFSNGDSFKYGYLTDVDGWDDSGNKVGTYPEASVKYEGSVNVDLSVSKPLEWATTKESYQLEENYKDILIQGSTDRYLFLPPDQEPSEEDRKLEEEGKLMISYGSSEVERKEFHSVGWREGDLQYLLYTFEDVQLEDLVAMAKETIDHAE